MIRRVIAIAIFTGASLFFAVRFHGPRSGVALENEDFPAAAPVIETVPPTTSVLVTTTLPTPSTTQAQVTLPTTPPATTTTTIPLPPDPGGGTVYEGRRFRTRWGSIKVDIRVVDGTMVDAEIVMIPKGTKRSRALTIEHEPTLRYQALTRQSPKVDVITGATEISEGYGWSLYVAMQEAGLWPPATE